MRAGIALGSNVGDRLANLTAGREEVLRLPGVAGPVLLSRVYETDPVGTGPESGPFLNAVMEVEFTGDPLALLAELRSIEKALGRPARLTDDRRDAGLHDADALPGDDAAA